MWPARVIRFVGVAIRAEQSIGVIVHGIDQVSICRQRILVHVDDFLPRLLVLGVYKHKKCEGYELTGSFISIY